MFTDENTHIVIPHMFAINVCAVLHACVCVWLDGTNARSPALFRCWWLTIRFQKWPIEITVNGYSIFSKMNPVHCIVYDSMKFKGFAQHIIENIYRLLEQIIMETAGTLRSASQDCQPHQELLRGNGLQSGARRTTHGELWGEDRSETGLPAVTLPLSARDRLDNEDGHRGEEKWYPVDNVDTARRPGLCRWPGTPIA